VFATERMSIQLSGINQGRPLPSTMARPVSMGLSPVVKRTTMPAMMSARSVVSIGVITPPARW
jgi:hypothetical protein